MSVQANKALVRDMIDQVWNEGHPDRLGDYWHDETHAQAVGLHEMLTEAFPDLHIQVEDLVAEDDCVVARLTFTGTHHGSFHGIESTGRQVRFGAIRIYQLREGKVIQTWAYQDALGLLTQLRTVEEQAPTHSG